MTTETQDERSQPQISDEELLLSYRDSADHAAFATLVHRYEREVYNYLARYLRNPQLAEEAFQATFLRLHQKSHLFAEDKRVRPWLYSIATSQAVDLLRREGRHQAISLDQRRQAARGTEETDALVERLEAGGPGPLDQLESDERRQWARRSVDQLPDHLRTIILMVYFQGLKYREAAEALGLPLGTVKSRLHKALTQLSDSWERDHSKSNVTWER